MRLLVDTNIFLDIILEREKFFECSKRFLTTSFFNGDQTLVNVSSLKDIYYIVAKFCHDKNKSLRAVNQIYQNVSKIIDCSSNDAISAMYEDGDYEDNILRQSALRTFCDAIITRNTKDFAKKDIPCLTPEEYLKIRK